MRKKEKKIKSEIASAIDHMQIRTNTRVKLPFRLCSDPLPVLDGPQLGILHRANRLLLISMIQCIDAYQAVI